MNIDKEKLERLLSSSQELLQALINSPVWGMVANEPVIQNWQQAIEEVQKEIEMEKVKGVEFQNEAES
jgi:hypothetical protein